MIRRISFFAMLFLFLLDPAWAADRLTLHECIDKALANHPLIRSVQETLNAGRGRATQATSPYLPQVQANTGYSENHTGGGAFGDTITKSYTTSLTVNQMLYDFGKTGYSRDAALLGTRSEEMDIDRVMQDVVLNVKQAYYALLQARKLLTVA
jgi:outer membrane protein